MSENKQENISINNDEFFAYKAPLDTPTLSIEYNIEYSLNDVINNAFKKMLISPNKEISNEFKSVKKYLKFKKRENTVERKSKLNTGVFKGNDLLHECEILEYESQLLPLLPDYNMDKLTKEVNQSNNENKNNENENNNNNNSNSNDADNNTNDNDNSWTSWNSWSNWGYSWIDKKAWNGTLNKIITALNQYISAEETWKIDWTDNKACSIVNNVSMSYVIGVNEYSLLIEYTKDNKKCVKFTKNLYINPIVSLPQNVLSSMMDEYKKDSEMQIQIINRLCKQKQIDINK